MVPITPKILVECLRKELAVTLILIVLAVLTILVAVSEVVEASPVGYFGKGFHYEAVCVEQNMFVVVISREAVELEPILNKDGTPRMCMEGE